MNFYSEEHELVRNTARKFAEKHLKPGVIERDENAEFPSAVSYTHLTLPTKRIV